MSPIQTMETSPNGGAENLPGGPEGPVAEAQHERALLTELMGSSASLIDIGIRAQQLRYHFLKFCVEYNKDYSRANLNQADIEQLLGTIQGQKEDSIDNFLVQLHHLKREGQEGQDRIVKASHDADIGDCERLLCQLRLNWSVMREYEDTVEAQYRVHLKETLVRFIRRHYSVKFGYDDMETVLNMFQFIHKKQYDNFRDNFKSLAEQKCCFEHPPDCECTHELIPHTCLNLLPVEIEVFKRKRAAAAKDTREKATLVEANNKQGLGNSMTFEDASRERESASANDDNDLQAHILSQVGENVMEEYASINGDADQDARAQLLGEMGNQPYESLQEDTELRVGTKSREANDADKPPGTSRLRPRVVPSSEEGYRRTNPRKKQVETSKRHSKDDIKPAPTRQSSRQAAKRAAQNKELLPGPDISRSKTSDERNKDGSFAREDEESNDESADDDPVLSQMAEIHRQPPREGAPEVTSGSMAETVVGQADRKTDKDVSVQNAGMPTEGSIEERQDVPEVDTDEMDVDQMDIDDGEAGQPPPNTTLTNSNDIMLERRQTTLSHVTVAGKKRPRSIEGDDQQPQQMSGAVGRDEVELNLNATKKRRVAEPRQQPPRAVKLRFAKGEAENSEKKQRLRSNKKILAQRRIEEDIIIIEKKKYEQLSEKINEHLVATIIAVKEEESAESEEAKAMTPEGLLQTISEDLHHASVASYYMAVSLLLKYGKIYDADLPNSASIILKPLLRLLNDKPYKPCIHPDFCCKKAQCFEQWYDLTRNEHGVASFRQFKARYWLRREEKYSSDLKTDFRKLIKKFSRRVIKDHDLTATLLSNISRKAPGESLPLETRKSRVHDSSKSNQGRSGKTARRNWNSRHHMYSSVLKRGNDGPTRVILHDDIRRARLIEELKVAKENLPEAYVKKDDIIRELKEDIRTLEVDNASQKATIEIQVKRISTLEQPLPEADLKQNDSISKLNKEILKLETDNANQKAMIETQVERISTLEQKEAAWDVKRINLEEKHCQEIQKLENEKQTQGQVSDEEIRNLTDELEKQKVRNREEEKRHKTEMETAESELQASKAELKKHQEKSKKSIDELTEAKETAHSNITKQRTMLNKWASAAFSYTESRIEWVKEEKLKRELRGKLRELQTLLRNQTNSEDSPDYAAIYKSWDELQRNKNLPTIEARIAEVKVELKVKHNGVVGVFRQCLLSISGRVAPEDVELPVDDMINLLKSAGLDSKPVLEHMREFFSQTYLAKLDSNTTKARNAVEVYTIYKPSFLLIDKIWKNKKDMQKELKNAGEEHEDCATTLQSLQKEKEKVEGELDDATKTHEDCATTLQSLRKEKEKVEEQLKNAGEEHIHCATTLRSLRKEKEKMEEQLKNAGEEHIHCATTLRSLRKEKEKVEEQLKNAGEEHEDCADTLQSLQKEKEKVEEQLKNAGEERKDCADTLKNVQQQKDAVQKSWDDAIVENHNLERRIQTLEKTKDAVEQELESGASDRDTLLKQQKQWSEAVKLMEAVDELYTASRGTGQTGSEFSQKTRQKPANKTSERKPVQTAVKKAIKDVCEDSDKSDGGSRSQDPEQRIEDCILNGDFADQRMLQHWHSRRCGCEDFLIKDGKVSTTERCGLNGPSWTVSASNAASDACWSMWQWRESASDDFAKISKTLKDTIARNGHIFNMLEQESQGKEADAKEDLADKTQKDDELDRNINAIAVIEEQISLIKFVQSIQDKTHNKIVPESLKSGKCADRHVIKCLHILLCGCDVVFPALSEATYDVTQYETCWPTFKDVLPKTIVEKAEGGTGYKTFYNFLYTKARCRRLEAKCSELEAAEQNNNNLLKHAMIDRSKSKNIAHLYQKASLYFAQLTVEPFNEKEWTQRGDDEPARRQVREAKLAQVWELLTDSVEKTQNLNDAEILKDTESYSVSKSVDTKKILSQLVGVAEISELAAIKSELERLKKRDASQIKALEEKLEKHKSIVKFVVSVHDKAHCSNASLTLESNPTVRDWADGKVIKDLHTILCLPDCKRDFSNLKKIKYAPKNYNSCLEEFRDALPENITDESNEEYEPYRVFLAAIAERCELNLRLKKTSLSNAGLNEEIEDLKEDLQDQRAKASQVVQSYQTFFLDFAQLVAKPLLAKEGSQSSTEDEDKDRQDKLEQVGSWLETLLEASGMLDDDKLKAPINIGTGSKSTVTTKQVFSLLIRMQEVPILEQRVLNLEAQLQSQDTKLNTLISSWTQLNPRDEDWTAGEVIGCIIEEQKRLLLEGKEEVTAGDETTEVKEEAYYDQILTEKEAIWRQLQNVEARHTLVCEALRTLSGSRASSQKFTSCLESGYIGTQENIVELHMILSESANVELSGDGSVKDCEDTTCAGAFLHKLLIKPPIKKEEDAAPVKWAIDRDISDELFLLRQIQVFWVLKRHLDETVSAILSLCSTQLLQKPKGDPFSALEFVADFKMDCMLSVMEYIIYKENREGHGRKNEANDQKVEGAIREKAEFIGMDWDVISARLTTEKRAAPKKLSEQNNRSEKGRSENDNEQKAAKGIKINALKRPEILIERITAEQLQFQDTKEKNLQFNQELDTLWAVCTRSLWIKGQLPQEDETQTSGKSRTTGRLASITKCISEVAQQLQDVESKCDTQYTTLQEEAGNNAQLSTILTAATWPSNAADYLGRILQKSSALQHMKDLRLEFNRAHFMVALKDFNFNGAEGESQSDIETVLQLANDGGIYYEELGGYLRTVATKGEEAPGINSEQDGIVEPNKILLIWDPILRHVLSLRKRYLEQESKTAECSSMIMELYTQCGGHSGTANRGGMDSEDKAHSKIESSTSQLKFLMAWVTDHPSQKQDKPDVNHVQGRHASEEDIQAAIRKGRQGVASFEEILKQSEQVLVGRCNSLEPDTLEKLKNLIKFPPYHGSWAEQLAAQLNLARDIGFSEGWQLEVQRVNLIPTLNNLSLCTDKAKVREAVKELGLSCERLVVIFPVLDCGESLDESNEVFELYKSHYKPKIDETQDSLHSAAMMELRTDCDNEILPDDGSVDLIRTTFEAEDGVNHIDIHEQFAADFLRKFCQDKHIELSNSDIQARIHDQKRIRGQIQSSEQIRAQQIDTSSAVVNMELKIDGIQYSIVDIRPGNGGHYAFEVHDKNKVRQLDKKSLGKILKSGSVDEVKQNRTTIYTALKQALSHDIPKVRPKDNEKEMKLPRMLRFARIKEFSKPDRWHVEYVGGGRAWVSGCTLAGWGLDVCGKMKEMKSQMVQQ